VTALVRALCSVALISLVLENAGKEEGEIEMGRKGKCLNSKNKAEASIQGERALV
jgi:hypothetical protein